MPSTLSSPQRQPERWWHYCASRRFLFWAGIVAGFSSVQLFMFSHALFCNRDTSEPFPFVVFFLDSTAIVCIVLACLLVLISSFIPMKRRPLLDPHATD